jgi:hypothetical protein
VDLARWRGAVGRRRGFATKFRFADGSETDFVP